MLIFSIILNYVSKGYIILVSLTILNKLDHNRIECQDGLKCSSVKSKSILELKKKHVVPTPSIMR